MVAKTAKLQRYLERIEQFRQNRIFVLDQKTFYNELNKSLNFLKEIPNAGECTQFWSDIWNKKKTNLLIN